MTDTQASPEIVERLRAYAVPWRAHGWTEEADAISEAAATIERLTKALETARDKFREYAELHRAKLADTNSPAALDAIMDKVNRNRDMADLCDATLNERTRHD